MKHPKLLWLIPPLCGIVSVIFFYVILIFSGVVNDSAGLVHFLEGTFTWVFWVIQALNVGPGGCKGMIWIVIAPGLAWFLYGTVLGSVWAIVIFLRLRRSGKLPNYRAMAAEIQARPEYEYFIQEDSERRYLYSEQLPLEFNKWLQQRRDT